MDATSNLLDIDTRIGELQTAISRLRQRRNALSRVHRLPPEVLSQIFLLYRTESSMNEDQYGDPSRSWWCIPRVCHYWRNVSFDCPLLWGDVDIEYPAALPGTRVYARAKEMFARSQRAHISVSVNLSRVEEDSTQILPLVLRELGRMRSLSMGGFRTSDIRKYEKELCAPAPALEALGIVSCVPLGDEPWQLPPNFLAGHAPHLRSFVAHDCFPWTTSDYMRALTSLCIRARHTNAAPPNLTAVLRVLQQTPQLQSLSLSTATFAPLYEDSSLSEMIVELPQLAYLSIESDLLFCTGVLEHLAASHLTTLNLDLRWSSPSLLGQLLSSLKLYWSSLAQRGMSIDSVNMCSHSSERITSLRGWNAETGHAEQPSLHLFLLTGQKNLSWSAPPMIAEILPVTEVADVHFDDPALQWTHTLGHFAGVRSLRIAESAAEWIAELSPTSQSFIAPQLEKLYLPDVPPGLIGNLEKCLRARKMRGRGLTGLQVAYLNHDELASLGEIVPNTEACELVPDYTRRPATSTRYI